MKTIIKKTLIIGVILVVTLSTVLLCACGDESNSDRKKDLKYAVISTDVTTIKADDFSQCVNLEYVLIPDNVLNIEAMAFAGCEKLTIYTTIWNPLKGWVAGWNYFGRPVVAGCKLSENNDYVVSFERMDLNPYNVNALNGVSNPYRSGYEFGGWYLEEDFSGTQYMDLVTAPNGTLYAKWNPIDYPE